MGLMDKAREVFGQEDEQDTSFEDEFEDVDDEDVGGGVEESVEEEEEQQTEWDTAYQFASWGLEERGFSSISEFIDKAMVHRINMSPMYRDKIESGIQTMDMISNSMSNIHELQGRFDDGGGRDYEEYVDEVRAANDLIDELDRMEGKEEQMANEIMGIARDAVDAISEGNKVSGKSVDSNVGVVEEDR